MSRANARMSRMRGAADQRQRQRQLVTPEGLSLPLVVASRGSRAGALLLDLLFIVLALLACGLALLLTGLNLGSFDPASAGPAGEFISILLVMLLFLSRYGYFLYFELGPRAATPGKRLLGIRVAARPIHGEGGGRLTAEMVIARNLMRDAEVFIPAVFLLGDGQQAGIAGAAALVWLAVFAVFPFCNRDALRAGDVIAGTWVVEARRARLKQAMSVAPDRSRTYRFGDGELSVYGEHELHVLERVLRQDDEDAMREVAAAICRKIGWQEGTGDDREFLESFYAALRGHLEGGMRFGKRKKDKFS